jgi:hypothetical protein
MRLQVVVPKVGPSDPEMLWWTNHMVRVIKGKVENYYGNH